METFLTMYYGTIGVLMALLMFTIATVFAGYVLMHIKGVRESITKTTRNLVRWMISIDEDPETGTKEFDAMDEDIII